MEVVLYLGANKKLNSTRIPTVAEMYPVTGELLSECSVTQPVIAVSNIPGYGNGDLRTISPHNFTYAYIEDFDRYYYIDNWTYSPPVWRASMSVDVLASYRENIFRCSEYVARSSAESDGTIIDTAYPATTDSVQRIMTPSQGDSAFTPVISEGTYIVGVINGSAESGLSIGAITYYAMNADTLGQFKRLLLGSVDYLNIDSDDLAPEIVRAFVNPYQYVTSCIWLPIRFDRDLYAPVSVLNLGWWQFGANLSAVTGSASAKYKIAFDIPKHPQSSRGEYLNHAPYTSYALWLPALGQVPINDEWLEGVESISVEFNIDLPTGKANIALYRGLDTLPIVVYPAQLGIHIQLAGTTSDIVGGVAQAAQTASNFISDVGTITSEIFTLRIGSAASDLLGSAASVSLGIKNAVETASPRTVTAGIQGAVSTFSYNPLLYAQFQKITEEERNAIGRPLMKKRVLGTLGGFAKIINPQLDYTAGKPMLPKERESVISYMMHGLYLE